VCVDVDVDVDDLSDFWWCVNVGIINVVLVLLVAWM